MCANIATSGCSSSRQGVVIFASPRRQGHTAAVLQQVLSRMPSGTKIDFFDCYQTPPRPCVDCKYCSAHQGCAQPDLKELYQNIEQADFVLFAFPIYYLSFPAPCKALFDRFQRYFSARFEQNIKKPVKKEKQVGLLMTCGSGDERGFQIAKQQTEMAFSVMNGKVEALLTFSKTDQIPPAASDAQLEQFLRRLGFPEREGEENGIYNPNP